MAQPALAPGMIVPRPRAFFGLLDRDGWAWAGLKSFVWLLLIILMLGYIPDRAYYFTVNRTIDIGVLAWSPINLCPPQNESLPCPAPLGAVVPWHGSPPELSLPAGRTDGTVVQVGTKILYVGGSDGSKAQADVYVAQTVGTGNFGPWEAGPPLPEPRADAAIVAVGGSIYVVGGFDASGTPTTTAYVLTPDSTTGVLGDWKPAPDALTLPEGRAGSSAVVTADGLLLLGGVGPNGLVNTSLKSLLDAKGVFGTWKEEAPLPTAVADAGAAVFGVFVFVYGGHDANGPTDLVQRGIIATPAAEGLPVNVDAGKIVEWKVDPAYKLPAPRDDAATWFANGTLYLAGGQDAAGPRQEFYWAIPTGEGAIPQWSHLDVTDLPVGLAGGSSVVTGPNVVIVGGETADGVVATSIRANTAPQTPFFQLGLVGATIPALQIGGEIGQQLGYLNAAGAGTVDFIILLLIGWAFAHPVQAKALIARVTRRR